VLAAAAPPPELLQLVDEGEGQQRLGEQPSPVEGHEVVLSVGKGGGASSGWATTYINDVEWSRRLPSLSPPPRVFPHPPACRVAWAGLTGSGARGSSTGRVGVSLAALSAIRDVSFSKARAVSRMEEMRTLRFLASRPRCAALLAAITSD